MKLRVLNQHHDQANRNDSDGLIQDREWMQLQASLRDMVATESERVPHTQITNNILRAIRSTPGGVKSLDELWSRALVSWFRPVVVAGMLLIVLLAAYNVRQTYSESIDLTTTERVLGLHPVTLASAYDIELESISR